MVSDGEAPEGALPDAADSDSAASAPSASEAEDSEESFLIVGIGASAGGLGAYQEFFEALPASPGMAFVLIQHLSPDHESALAELLQTKTDLAVNQVADRLAIRPNCVYVIPPGKHLELRDSYLELVELERDRGRPTTVDHFFRSLAREAGERAVAVVLSGTGSDGSLGLKAVKEQAGWTLAQTPEDAEYDGMPRSAIATGCVDLTGTPAELAEKLVGVPVSAESIQLPEVDEEVEKTDEQALRSIFSHLRHRSGHDFTHYKRSTILRRLARRLQVAGLSTLSEYAAYLRVHPEEAGVLLREFLISVTQFFRDPDSFVALEEEVLPDLFQRAEGQIRAWVPGCATGEEAYSLAMLLCEHAHRVDGARPDIQIFATDIDVDALAHAREGLYSAAVVGDLPPERLQRFFSAESGGYRVKPAIRDMVLFAPHNIVADPPFSRLDLVSCRNVLIYFNRKIQERAFASFHYALRLDGYLFLGASESPDTVSNAFVEVDKRARIYRRRDVVADAVDFPFPRTHRVAPSLSQDSSPDSSPEADSDRPPAGLVERYAQWTLSQYAPPRLLVDERYNLTHVFGRAGDYLRDREGPVTQNAIDKVIRAFRIDVRTALYRAFAQGETVDTPFRRIEVGTETRFVRLHVGPVGGAAGRDGLAEVVFIELDPASVEDLDATIPGELSEHDHPAVGRLEEELRSTRARLQATVEEQETSNEELKASNEELQSINEELQSATEELETSKEELQSMNEELTTLNQELKIKVEELTRSNSDLQNLMGSMEVATLFLDSQLRLKRYTPRAADLFHVIPSDLGRPFSHLSHTLDRKDLDALAQSVHETLVPVEATLRSEDEQTFLLRALPYRTVDDRIDGVVLTFVNVSEVEDAKASAVSRAEQQEFVARLGERALAGASLDDLFTEATAGVREALDASACKVLRHEAGDGRLRLMAGVGWSEGLVGEATVPDSRDSQAGYTLLARETILVDDLDHETRFTAPDLLTNHDLKSGMSVVIPSARGDEPYGVLGVHSREPRTYTEADGRFLQSVANILADAITASRQRTTIREQLAEIEAVYETAPVGLAFLDESLRYRRVNRRLAEINGRAVEEHLGQHTRDIIPDLAEAVEPILKRILATGEPVEEVEIRGPSPLDPDDMRVWLCSYVPRYDDDGRPLGISLVVRDITDRKQVEETLSETAARLDVAMDGAGLGAYETDLGAGTVTYDARAQSLLAVPEVLPLDEAYGNIHPDDVEEVRGRIEAATDPSLPNDTFVSVHRHLREGAPPIWITARGRCLFGGEGEERRPDRLLGVIFDVTAFRAAQEMVQRQLSEVESYFDALPVGIAIFDRQGRYVRVNMRLADLVGKVPEDLIGEAARYIVPEHAPDNEPYLQRVLDTGVPILNAEMRLPRPADPEGDLRDWLVSFYPLWNGDVVAGASVVIQDVTAIRRAERGLGRLAAELEKRVAERTAQVRALAADLSEAEQRERQRVAQILHDHLQQLLYALQVKHHLLRQSIPEADADSERLVDEAEHLLEEALQSTRSLTVELSPPVLKGEGLDRALEWLARRMEEGYGLEVEVEAANNIHVGGGIEALLFQIVRELLFNVVKHADVSDARVEVVEAEDEVTITVSDQGVGFEVGAEDHTASGLGLFSVRERIGLVGGTVDVESEPGRGTVVVIRCPLSGNSGRDDDDEP